MIGAKPEVTIVRVAHGKIGDVHGQLCSRGAAQWQAKISVRPGPSQEPAK
jgi:hypothetical protein